MESTPGSYYVGYFRRVNYFRRIFDSTQLAAWSDYDRPARSLQSVERSLVSRYSYLSATIGSTRAALLAGIQHARTPVASNNKTVPAKLLA
jgi:hypothetical protein